MIVRRGDVVSVAAPGDFGKPRPGVVIQSDVFPDDHISVIICPMTSTIAAADEFRVTVAPSTENGLRLLSQVMVDKPITLRRDRLGERIGQLGAGDIRRLNVALAFVVGLAD